MMDNTDTSSPQMDGVVKLDSMMEQLQRQQHARLEMQHKERLLREAHILYAQQVAAQQAILVAARASGAGFMSAGTSGPLGPPLPSQVSNQSSVDSEREDERGRDSGDEDSEEDELPPGALDFLRNQALVLQRGAGGPFGNLAEARAAQRAPSPPVRVKEEPEDELSHAEHPDTSSPNGRSDWSYEQHFKVNGDVSWSDDVENIRGRAESSRDFAKLYELDSDPRRKEFLDDLFTFMQKRGTPVNRIPIMAKQVLDLYMLYKLVTEKGGLVEVINKKIWREITRGLNLPTSITSAAFTLRTQYMKYLYPFECERKALSSPTELQTAIDSNRREGRRPSYCNSLFRFSPSPSPAPHILSPPTMHLSALSMGAAGTSPGSTLKKGLEDAVPSLLAGRSSLALALGQQQSGLARAAMLEQLREKLETETPERKMLRLAEEQQRRLHQALQQNLLAMTSHIPMNLRLPAPPHVDEKRDLAISISSSGAAGISMSVEVNGVIYSGTLFAQKSSATAVNVCLGATAPPSGPTGVFNFPIPAPGQSPASSSSSKGRSTSGSP
ncbi:AT-rich interactive domain-containing protein 3B-like [Triplophysa rosa]|uniref:AT-rich interactive domain-containing protein 3 n=1 Tax=Triplophysa rosa TaxID=992332 RepID=A0A9W7WHP7_TRIRA|nr:AT-rich interactive domain-containing protein 3B-like [Triplophysa rosa]KAI7802112.1 putative AT-rich interactive domain-containing protein 3B [Triplophysa rosa]